MLYNRPWDPGAGFGGPGPRGPPCLEDSLTSFANFEGSRQHRNGNARDLLGKRNTTCETLLVDHVVLSFPGLCHVEFWISSDMVHTPEIIAPHMQHHEEV